MKLTGNSNKYLVKILLNIKNKTCNSSIRNFDFENILRLMKISEEIVFLSFSLSHLLQMITLWIITLYRCSKEIISKISQLSFHILDTRDRIGRLSQELHFSKLFHWSQKQVQIELNCWPTCRQYKVFDIPVDNLFNTNFCKARKNESKVKLFV